MPCAQACYDPAPAVRAASRLVADSSAWEGATGGTINLLAVHDPDFNITLTLAPEGVTRLRAQGRLALADCPVTARATGNEYQHAPRLGTCGGRYRGLCVAWTLEDSGRGAMARLDCMDQLAFWTECHVKF